MSRSLSRHRRDLSTAEKWGLGIGAGVVFGPPLVIGAGLLIGAGVLLLLSNKKQPPLPGISPAPFSPSPSPSTLGASGTVAFPSVPPPSVAATLPQAQAISGFDVTFDNLSTGSPMIADVDFTNGTSSAGGFGPVAILGQSGPWAVLISPTASTPFPPNQPFYARSVSTGPAGSPQQVDPRTLV